MTRYLLRTLGAQLRRAPSLYALTLAGVALGVAAVLTVQIVNRNALAAFAGSVQAVSGDADLSVLGRGPTFADSLYPAVLGTPGVAAAWALYRADLAVADEEAFYLDAVGVDLFAPVTVPFVGEAPDSPEASLAEALAQPGWTAISPELARRLALGVGDTLAVTSGARRLALTIGALVDFRRLTPLAGTRLIVLDLAQAQHLLDAGGRLTQIDLRAADGADVAALAARLQERLGPAVEIVTPEQRQQEAEGLLSAFRLNLTALSFISFFVGVFLVQSAVQASLVRRRAEFGLLRSLGATSRQVLVLIAAEVALLGALGTAIGLPLGYWTARANVELVSATLTNLYLLQEIERLHLPAGLYLLAAAIGVGGALAGALLPALDMTRRDTKALLAAFTLHEQLRSRAAPLFLVGLGLLLGTAGWYALGGHRWQPAGFALAVALMVALPLLTPFAVRRIAAVPGIRDFGLAYGIRSLGVRLQTTAFATAGLGVAVSMLVGITLMIGSFRETLAVWVDSSLRADVYITTPSWRGRGEDAVLDPALIGSLGALPGVRAVDRLRGFPARTGERRVTLAGVEMGLPFGESRFPLLSGARDSVLAAVHRGRAVLVSEPLARKAGLRAGDMLPLDTPGGERWFPIAGVYYDYSSENGTVIMDLATLAEAFGDGPVNSIALYLEADRDPEDVVGEIRTRWPGVPLLLRSNRALRADVFTVFEQTFAITRILQAMALLIAVCGITLTLLVLARERLSELALYRALGAHTRQIFALFLVEGTGIGVLGLVLGLVGGALLAGVLVFVINRAYFGWTIQVAIPGGTLAFQAATILVAAALASLYPAWRASRTTAAELARDDV